MRKPFYYLLITNILLSSCASNLKNDDVSNMGEISNYLSEISENKKISFQITLNKPLPSIKNANQVYTFDNSLKDDVAYFYELNHHDVIKVNIQTGQNIGNISFSNLPENAILKYVYLDDDLNIWYADTMLYVYNNQGEFIKNIHLSLNHLGKDYVINSHHHTPIQYFKNSNTLIIPINCISEYEANEAHALPQFAAYNLISEELAFLPIYLPNNYPADKNLGDLSSPYTAKEDNTFYAIFPLSNQLYAYDVISKSLQIIPLQLPVALTNANMLEEPTTLTNMANLKYYTNHLAGMAVINGKIFIQQTDVFNQELASKKYIDNTVLYVFNEQGQLLSSNAFQAEIFDEIGVFELNFANNDNLVFTSFNRNNDKKIIQLKPQL
ncbi:MAG: hypothetical protein ACK4IK_11190 [Bacteroidia bacterium]